MSSSSSIILIVLVQLFIKELSSETVYTSHNEDYLLAGGRVEGEGAYLEAPAAPPPPLPPSPPIYSSDPGSRHFIRKHVSKYKRWTEEMVNSHFGEDEENTEVFLDEDPRINDNNNSSSRLISRRQRRRKRAVIFQDQKYNVARSRRKTADHESEGTFVINQVDRTTPQYYDSTTAIDINCKKVEDKTLVFSIETTERGREIMMHELNDKNLRQRLLFQTPAPDAVSVDVFKVKGQLFAFTTVNHQPHLTGSTEKINTGSTLYRVNLSNSTFDKTQTIHLPFAKSNAFWTGMGSEANEIFLALAPEKSVVSSGKTSYSVVVPLYRWQGGYFDYVSQLPANNPQSIQHFPMFSHDYLAVANYQDDTGSTSIQSEIFKYHHKESKFVSFQKIQTYGAKDIRHFTFSNVDERRQEHFIAIANSCKRDENGKPQFWVQSTIMKFGSTRFLPFKSFHSYGALQFLPVKDGNKFFLAFADLHGIRIFQYNGWTFVETFAKKFEMTLNQGSNPFSVNLRQFSTEGKTYFTVATANQQVENGMFRVGFETRNDHRKLVTSVEAWCKGANQQVNGKDLSDLEKRLNAAPNENDERIDIRGDLKFESSVKITKLSSQSLRLGRGRSLDEDKFKEMAKVEGDINKLDVTMNHLHSKMVNNVVWTNEMDLQEINSHVKFSQPVNYENEGISLRHLRVENKMGSIQVNDHLENAIFLNQPNKLKSIVTDTVVANDVTLTTLNGVLLKDYAQRHPSSSQVFTGNNEFLSTVHVTKEIQVGHKFAGLSFTQPEFLLYKGNQTFPGMTMDLTGSTVNNLYTRTLNDVDVFTMFQDAVPLSGGVIKADKKFVSDKVEIKNAKVIKINGEDIDFLYENAIYAKGEGANVEQMFTAPVYFENLEIDHITPENPNVNEQFDVNFNFGKKDGGKYTVKNMKMTKATDIDQLLVTSQLNNVKVLQNGNNQLDIFLKKSNEVQHVKSKVLKSVHFNEHVEATEFVDGVHLAGWSNEQKIMLTENEIRGVLNVLGGNVKFDDGLFAKKSFKQNNNDVMHVLQNSARTDSEMLPGSCTLHFDSLEVKGNSDVRGKVNKVLPSQWVVNSEKSNQLEITGKKDFEGTVHLQKDVGANILIGGEPNGHAENLLEVFPTLLLNGVDQTINTEMGFGKAFRANSASCPNTILDKVPFENIMLKRGDQMVEVETSFRSSFKAEGDVQVLGDVTPHFVNEINIKDQLKNTLRTNGDEVGVQKITGEWKFNDLSVMDNSEVMGSLSGSDVKSLYGDIIRKDSNTIKLDGMNLKFGQGVMTTSVEFIGHLNKIPTDEWGKAWLLSGSDQVVESKVEFAGPVTAKMFEAPSVNGVDVSRLSENILRIDRDEDVMGNGGSPITFNGLVNTMAGISMPNGVNVNGIDLAKDVLLKNSDSLQTISGAKTFKNGMTIKGNMMVNEIPGFDIKSFANLVNGGGPTDGRSSSLHIKGDLKLENEPEVTSTVNGKDWNEVSNSIWMRRKDVVLKNPVKFKSLTLNQGGNMEESARLNGVNLKHLEKNYASKTRPQTWTGDVILENVVGIEQLTSNSLKLENDGKLNDVNVKEFYDSVLRYTGDQEIVGRDLEAENLVVTRLQGDDGKDVKINDVNVKDLMTVSGPNHVTATKTLKSLKVKSLALSEDTVIDGVNLGEWNAGAVTRSGVHEIQGPLEFESLKATENVVVDGLVDSMKFDLENVVTTDKDQVLPNRVTVKSHALKGNKRRGPAVTAKEGVIFKGKVDGVDIENHISKMVFKTEIETKNMEPIIIKGETVFNAPLVLNQVKTNALIQGQNVTAIMDTMSRAHDEVHNNAFLASERYSKLLSMTKRMMEVSEKRAVFLDYFVLTQTIKVHSTYVKVLREVGYPVVAIGFKKSEKVTTENWWSYSAAVDYYQLQIGNRVQLEGTVTDIAELSLAKNDIDNNNMFAFAVNDVNERPAHAALDVIQSNNVHSFELNKGPDKLSKAFILKSVDVGTASMRPAISQVIYSHGFKSIRSFSVVTKKGKNGGLTSCMAATNKVNNEMDSTVKIFCMDNASGALEAVQEMNLESPSLTTSTRVLSTDTTLLGILTRSGEGHPEGLLEIWGHTQGKGKTQRRNPVVQFAKESCLPVFNAVSLDSLSTPDGKTFLAVASGALRGSQYLGSVFIYRYSPGTKQFRKVQTIQANHPTDVKFQWLKPSNEVVMYVLSQSMTNNVQVYKRQGLSGWSLVHQFTSEDGRSLEVADFTVDGIYRAQVLVTSPTETSIYAAEFMGVNTVIEEELMESSHENSVSSSLREFIDFDNL